MKRYCLFVLFALLLIVPFNSLAASPGFLLLDQSKDVVEVFSADLKPVSSFKTGPKPAAIVTLPDGNGYLLMFRGSKNLWGSVNAGGGLVYLTPRLEFSGKKIDLPGLVVKDYYFKDSAIWILITKNQDTTSAQATVTIINLQNGTNVRFNLNSAPTACQVNSERTILALTTIGIASKRIPSQLLLIDLHQLTLKSFPVSANPGGIYFVNDHKILVACSGFRSSFKYSADVEIEKSEKSLNANLHWIDTINGTEQITQVGYSPLVVIQDRTNRQIFYTASSDSAYDEQQQGTLRKLEDGFVQAKISFPAEPVKLIQTKQGTICLIGREEFFLFNQDGTKTLTNLTFKTKIEGLRLNGDESLGFLTNVNGSNLNIIDLTSGSLVHQLKIRPSGLFGSLSQTYLFPAPLPPVDGMIPLLDDKMNYGSQNHQNLLSTDSNRFYLFSNVYEIKSIDLKTTQTWKSRFKGAPYGLHLTPNEKYLVLVTDSIWHLFDINQGHPVLKIPLYKGNYPPNTGYYSPDENILVIPSNGYLYFVDYQNGKLVNKLRTKIQNPIITWIQ